MPSLRQIKAFSDRKSLISVPFNVAIAILQLQPPDRGGRASGGRSPAEPRNERHLRIPASPWAEPVEVRIPASPWAEPVEVRIPASPWAEPVEVRVPNSSLSPSSLLPFTHHLITCKSGDRKVVRSCCRAISMPSVDWRNSWARL